MNIVFRCAGPVVGLGALQREVYISVASCIYLKYPLSAPLTQTQASGHRTRSLFHPFSWCGLTLMALSICFYRNKAVKTLGRLLRSALPSLNSSQVSSMRRGGGWWGLGGGQLGFNLFPFLSWGTQFVRRSRAFELHRSWVSASLSMEPSVQRRKLTWKLRFKAQVEEPWHHQTLNL